MSGKPSGGKGKLKGGSNTTTSTRRPLLSRFRVPTFDGVMDWMLGFEPIDVDGYVGAGTVGGSAAATRGDYLGTRALDGTAGREEDQGENVNTTYAPIRSLGNPCDPAGLRNLGNTCYLNSIVQCFAAVERLRGPFVDGTFACDINARNALGSNGRVSTAWAQLLHDMAKQHAAVASPHAFKKAIARESTQWADHDQQDSHELACWLLDTLHEDLNRVQQKPLTEKAEGDGTNEAALAAEALRRHRLRNDSAIADTCEGQLKSTIRCGECGKLSVSFDPFMSLAVPLPHGAGDGGLVTIHVTLRRLDGGLSRVTAAELASSGTVDALLAAVAEREGLRVDALVCGELYRCEVHRLFAGHEPLDVIDASDYIFVWELEAPVRRSTKVLEAKVAEASASCAAGVGVRAAAAREAAVTAVTAVTAETAEDWPIVSAVAGSSAGVLGDTVSIATGGAAEECDEWEVVDGVPPHYDAVVELPPEAVTVLPTQPTEAPAAAATPPWVQAATATPPWLPAAAAATAPTEQTPPGSPLDGQEPSLLVTVTQRVPGSYPGSRYGTRISGVPIMLTVPAGATGAEVHALVEAQLRRYEDAQQKARRAEWPYKQYELYHFRSCGRQGERIRASGATPCLSPAAREVGWTGGRHADERHLMLDWLETAFGKHGYYDERTIELDEPRFSGAQAGGGGGIGGGGLHAAAPRVALRECVDLFSAQEDLGGDDAWYCPRCKTHRCGTKRLQTWSLPDVLVLQLKRFEVRGGLRRKLAGAVDCPIEGLDLSEFCLSPDPDGSLYDLQAVSNHYGSAHGGHYTACSRVGGDWYECDDQHVRRVTAESVVTPAAYVLIYARRRPNTKDAPKLTMGSDTKALTTAWL